MAIRKILNERTDNTTLRRKCRVVEQVDDRILMLLDDMLETMVDANGVGLAAPQVGVLRRLAVVDVEDGTGPYFLINPEIIEREGEQVGPEGCLSVSHLNGTVTRPNKIKVKALDREGNERIYEAEGYLARAMCHEIDHLDGILFIDIASDLYDPDDKEREKKQVKVRPRRK